MVNGFGTAAFKKVRDSMAKLSVLIFSRNDIRKAVDLVMDVYGIADEIVLVDSSDDARRKELLASKRRLGLDKLRIFYAVALGYPDPLRAYALKKCRHPWVLLIDTDERMNAGFKAKIRGIISGARCSAFAIKRYEYVRRGKPTGFFTWNIRLYKKDRITYKGILHEQPLVRGRLAKMDDSCCLMHMDELRTEGSPEEYAKILKFGRLSYRDFNDRMVDYLSKVVMPESRSLDGSRLGGALRSLLTAYERLTLKKPGQELSGFDYFAYNFLIDTAFAIKRSDPMGVFRQIPVEMAQARQIEAWKREPDGKEAFEISKILSERGIIKYLGLDREETIARLNREYAREKQGISLLLRLLKEKYERERAHK
jgi:hypothetical protein